MDNLFYGIVAIPSINFLFKFLHKTIYYLYLNIVKRKNNSDIFYTVTYIITMTIIILFSLHVIFYEYKGNMYFTFLVPIYIIIMSFVGSKKEYARMIENEKHDKEDNSNSVFQYCTDQYILYIKRNRILKIVFVFYFVFLGLQYSPEIPGMLAVFSTFESMLLSGVGNVFWILGSIHSVYYLFYFFFKSPFSFFKTEQLDYRYLQNKS